MSKVADRLRSDEPFSEKLNNEAADEIERLERQVNVLRSLFLQHMGVNGGWHGNPDNHTISLFLFCSSKDYRELLEYSKSGHCRVTERLLDTIIYDFGGDVYD